MNTRDLIEEAGGMIPKIISEASTSTSALIALAVIMTGLVGAAYIYWVSADRKHSSGRAVKSSGARASRTTSAAPHWIKGTVIDENNGSFVAWATVSTVDALAPTTTDSEGSFSLPVSPSATSIFLSISKSGYASKNFNVTIPLPAPLVITLSKSSDPALEKRLTGS